jgi:hypothetical protein
VVDFAGVVFAGVVFAAVFVAAVLAAGVFAAVGFAGVVLAGVVLTIALASGVVLAAPLGVAGLPPAADAAFVAADFAMAVLGAFGCEAAVLAGAAVAGRVAAAGRAAGAAAAATGTGVGVPITVPFPSLPTSNMAASPGGTSPRDRA